MAREESGRRKHVVVAIIIAVAGIATSVAMSSKAHEFYDPNRMQFDIEEPQSSFRLDPGRYELAHKQELGKLAFQLVSAAGKRVEVKPFDLLTRLFHTQGWQGHAFVADQAGQYELSVNPWPTGAKVNLSSTNTNAIARWSGAGMLISVLSCVVAGFVLLQTVCRRAMAPTEGGAATKPQGTTREPGH